jgi:hypothetical protein
MINKMTLKQQLNETLLRLERAELKLQLLETDFVMLKLGLQNHKRKNEEYINSCLKVIESTFN